MGGLPGVPLAQVVICTSVVHAQVALQWKEFWAQNNSIRPERDLIPHHFSQARDYSNVMDSEPSEADIPLCNSSS